MKLTTEEGVFLYETVDFIKGREPSRKSIMSKSEAHELQKSLNLIVGGEIPDFDSPLIDFSNPVYREMQIHSDEGGSYVFPEESKIYHKLSEESSRDLKNKGTWYLDPKDFTGFLLTHNIKDFFAIARWQSLYNAIEMWFNDPAHPKDFADNNEL